MYQLSNHMLNVYSTVSVTLLSPQLSRIADKCSVFLSLLPALIGNCVQAHLFLLSCVYSIATIPFSNPDHTTATSHEKKTPSQTKHLKSLFHHTLVKSHLHVHTHTHTHTSTLLCHKHRLCLPRCYWYGGFLHRGSLVGSWGVSFLQVRGTLLQVKLVIAHTHTHTHTHTPPRTLM